jgi:hypothetical protein
MNDRERGLRNHFVLSLEVDGDKDLVLMPRESADDPFRAE